MNLLGTRSSRAVVSGWIFAAGTAAIVIYFPWAQIIWIGWLLGMIIGLLTDGWWPRRKRP